MIGAQAGDVVWTIRPVVRGPEQPDVRGLRVEPGEVPLPTVASAGFWNDSAHQDDHLGEGNPEVDDASTAFGAPHRILVGVNDPLNTIAANSSRTYTLLRNHYPSNSG